MPWMSQDASFHTKMPSTRYWQPLQLCVQLPMCQTSHDTHEGTPQPHILIPAAFLLIEAKETSCRKNSSVLIKQLDKAAYKLLGAVAQTSPGCGMLVAHPFAVQVLEGLSVEVVVVVAHCRRLPGVVGFCVGSKDAEEGRRGRLGCRGGLHVAALRRASPDAILVPHQLFALSQHTCSDSLPLVAALTKACRCYIVQISLKHVPML
jgi:hypothetical protein